MLTTLLAQTSSELGTFFGTIKQPEALEPYGTQGGLIVFISNILTVIVLSGGLFALFNIVTAGYLYLTGSGDAKAHEKVLSKLNMSLLGLGLMIMAPAIMAVMGWVLFKNPSFFLKPQLKGPKTSLLREQKKIGETGEQKFSFSIVPVVYAVESGGEDDVSFPDPLGGTVPITGPGAKNFQPDLSSSGASAGGKPIEQFLSVLLGFFTIVGGLMFLMYFVFGGLAWLSAGGDKGKVEGARTQLTNAAIGLIIVIVSQAIIGIVSGVLGLSILNPATALGGLFR